VPKLVTGFAGSSARGSAYYFTAHLVPAAAGTLALKVARGRDVILDRTFGSRVRVKLDTKRLTTYRITTQVVPSEGYASAVRSLRASVVLPRLVLGARNTAVAQVGDQLRRLHYAAPYGLRFDGRMLDAVYAFQKVHLLPRTGAVDARFWQALATPRHPTPKFARPAAHIEVNKGLQVLYVVRGSKIALIVPISTAGIAGAFTPVGAFAVYRKVGGFDPSPLGTLYDPLYFTGGYAIHGNPSVPPYPASHGCVRVPVWVAPQLYETIPYGETVTCISVAALVVLLVAGCGSMPRRPVHRPHAWTTRVHTYHARCLSRLCSLRHRAKQPGTLDFSAADRLRAAGGLPVSSRPAFEHRLQAQGRACPGRGRPHCRRGSRANSLSRRSRAGPSDVSLRADLASAQRGTGEAEVAGPAVTD
jgi:hypothetical protein